MPVKVAFFQDLSASGASQVVTPSYLGLRLALDPAGGQATTPAIPEVVALDTEGDPAQAAELAHEVADDPSYVAAVIAPFWAEPIEVGNILDAAGIPTLSLSGLDPNLPDQGWGNWRRLVAAMGRQVSSFASALRASSRRAAGICVVGDGSTYSGIVSASLREEIGGAPQGVFSATLDDETTADKVVDQLGKAGCDTIAWTGYAPGAIALSTALADTRSKGLPVIGMDAMKADAYLTATAGAGEGTIVTCACVDLASSTSPDVGRFIHDYQSEYGSPPGAYGAEGWDAGAILADAFASGAVDRLSVASRLAVDRSYRGLANTYRFASDGELDQSSTSIHVFRAEGVRWVPVGADAPETAVPVGTPGYLSVASCRTGRPFAYREAGRLRGFDVDLARAIARRLDLTLSWSDGACPASLRSVAAGTLDAVIVPQDRVGQGTPATRIVLSSHAALVSTLGAAGGDRPLLSRLEPGDVVAVLSDQETRRWATAAIPAAGATVRLVRDPQVAYRGLASGSFAAVAEPEREAWVAVERRPGLAVAQSVDIGAHDVIVAKGPDSTLTAAIDQVLGRLIRSGRYTLLFARYFPGVPIPPETGT